jgi:hypothetical protein
MDQTPLSQRGRASKGDSHDVRDHPEPRVLESRTASGGTRGKHVSEGVPELFFSGNKEVLDYMRQSGFSDEDVDSMEVVLYTEEPDFIIPSKAELYLPSYLAKTGLSDEHIGLLISKLKSAEMISERKIGRRCDCPVSSYT